MEKKDTIDIEVTLPLDIIGRIEIEALERGMTRDELIREILDEKLPEKEK